MGALWWALGSGFKKASTHIRTNVGADLAVLNCYVSTLDEDSATLKQQGAWIVN